MTISRLLSLRKQYVFNQATKNVLMKRRISSQSSKLIRNFDGPLCTIKFNEKIVYELYFPPELTDAYTELHTIRASILEMFERDKIQFMGQASVRLVELRAMGDMSAVNRLLDQLPTIWKAQKKEGDFAMPEIRATSDLYLAEFNCRSTRHDAAAPVKNEQKIGILEMEEHVNNSKQTHAIHHQDGFYFGFGFEFEFLPGIIRAQTNLSLTKEPWAAKLAENVFVVQQFQHEGIKQTYYYRTHRSRTGEEDLKRFSDEALKEFCEECDIEPEKAKTKGFRIQQGSPMMSDPKARMLKFYREMSVEEKELEKALQEAGQSTNSMRIGTQPLVISDAESPLPKNFTMGGSVHRRGMVLPHRPNPPSRSLSCVCDHCDKSFRLVTHVVGRYSSYFHQDPFGGFLYSKSGNYTLLIPAKIPGCPLPKDPTDVTEEDMSKIQNFINILPKAPDGSKFAFENGFKCPFCKEPYVNYERHQDERHNDIYGLSLFEYPETVLIYDEEGFRSLDTWDAT